MSEDGGARFWPWCPAELVSVLGAVSLVEQAVVVAEDDVLAVVVVEDGVSDRPNGGGAKASF